MTKRLLELRIQTVERLSLGLRKCLRAYLAKPEHCGPAHDQNAYEVARMLGHEARECWPELR